MFYAFCHNWSIVLCETKSKLFPARIPNYQAVFRKVWILYKFGFVGKSKLLDFSMMLYYRVFNCIKAAGLTSRYSVKDIMTYLKRFTYQKINGEEIREIPTKVSIDKLRNIFPEEMKRIVPEKSNKKN